MPFILHFFVVTVSFPVPLVAFQLGPPRADSHDRSDHGAGVYATHDIPDAHIPHLQLSSLTLISFGQLMVVIFLIIAESDNWIHMIHDIAKCIW
jgi:hypothetical protein